MIAYLQYGMLATVSVAVLGSEGSRIGTRQINSCEFASS